VAAECVSRATHTALKNSSYSNRNDTNAECISFSQVASEGEERFKSQPIDDGFVLVQKRRLRNRFLGKTGKAIVDTNSNFKAADIKIPIYINNVSKETTVCDIQKYINSKTNLDVYLEKMNMRVTKEYNSFKILAPKCKVDMFLSDDFWPDGVMYRRFVDFNRNSERRRSYRDMEKTKQTSHGSD
jgi:hypothetical protein